MTVGVLQREICVLSSIHGVWSLPYLLPTAVHYLRILWQRFRSRWLLLAAVAAVLTIPLARSVAQSGDEPPGEVMPSAQEVAEIKNKAQALLRDLAPRSSPPNVPYVRQPDQPTAKLETDAGTVQWGNLFVPDETVALVNLAPSKTDEDEPDEVAPQYLCVFVWKADRWTFRQFLGNVYNLSVHHRRDRPAAFLQGSRKTGRHEGDHLSWFYDPKNGQLIETKFEDWGPFYLVGDYLILGRGFERLAHDDTHWIYSYRGGKKGRQLAVMHENDSGRFDIECPDRKSGRMQRWSFVPEDEKGERLSVTVADDPKEGDAEGGTRDDKAPSAQVTGLDSRDFFGFLTGLNPALLDDKWMDKPPKWSAPKRLSVEVTGSRIIAARFR